MPALLSRRDGVPATGRLRLPDAVDPRKISWLYAGGLVAYHLAALLAFVPWFFSWAAVWVAVAGVFFFALLGINVGYHRLLAHRGFTCPKWLERGLALLGALSFQDSPARWVAAHRRHHHHSDQPDDPHSPLVSFFWAHVGWLLVANADLGRLGAYDSYAKDIIRDPFYKWIERRYVFLILLSWVAFFLAGAAGALLAGAAMAAALQSGAGILVWGVFVRTVCVWHSTWSVNSVAHLWGYRSYATDEASRNNWFVALIAGGEGWHNNHHADQRSARHGHRWWEVDFSWWAIRLLALLGLARDIALPRPRLGDHPIATRQRVDHADD